MRYCGIKLISVCLFYITLGTATYAGNISFMNNSAISFFSGQDMNVLVTAANKALERSKDGSKLTWRNPNTGTWGYFIPTKTMTVNGNRCRNLTIFINARNVTDESTYQFCKINGEWRTE